MKRVIIFCLAFIFSINLLMAQKTDKQKGFHTFLGVDVDNTSVKTDGLFINGVYKNNPAEEAGLQRADILKTINNTSAQNFDELVRTLDKYDGGDNVAISLFRNNQPQMLNITLTNYPEFLKYNSMRWLKEKTANAFDAKKEGH